MARKRYHFDPSGRRSRRRGGGNPLMTVLVVVTIAALVFIGWNIYIPLKRVLSGDTASAVSASSSKAVSSKSASSKASSAAGSASSSVSASAVHGIYLAGSALPASSISQTLSVAKSAGVTTAITELKSDDGVVHYASKISEVQNNGIAASGAMAGTTIAQVITQSGMTPAAYISCFKDPLAPTVMRDAAVKYDGNHSTNWLDESNNRWLNPYSFTAVQYIADLAVEAVGQGFKQIYLANVQFPAGAQNHAWYGDNLSTKEAALKSAVATITQKVHAAGGTVTLVLPANAAVGSGTASLGQDQDPFGYGADAVSPLFTAASLTGVTVNGTAISSPAGGNLAGAISTAAQGLKALSTAKLDGTAPFIQAGAVTGSSAVTADVVNAQIAALKSAGIDSYVLYATGSYTLTGVSAQ